MIRCYYIMTEQTEINIKDSTKDSKIKVLVWLSNHFDDGDIVQVFYVTA
jgi:hypothetical protein